MTVYARIAFDPIIGDVSPVLSVPVPSARIAFDAIIGNVNILVTPPPSVRIAFDAVVGRVRIKVMPQADEWSLAGFPCPTLGYSYSRNQGVIRTRMESGYVRQRRRWTDGMRAGTLQFTLSRDLLYDLEDFLDTKEGTWFGISLVTGDSPTSVASLHTVRAAGDLTFSQVLGDTIDMSLPVDIQ